MRNFLTGSLRLSVEGDCERLLNLCRENNIPLWDIERRNGFSVCFSLCLYNIYSFIRLCRRARCRFHTEGKKGLPFRVKRVMERPGLVIGFALCMAALWIMCQCVWVIDINVQGDINKEEVRQLLSEAGLKPGAPVRSVRAQKIKNSVISASDEIAYLTVNVKGSRATVNIYPRRVEKMPTPTEPCDVISGLTGVVTAIRVKQGSCQLRVGQTVQKGDIIAKGEITDALGQTRYYRADAEIDLRTWYTQKSLIPTELFEYIPTDNTKTKRYLTVGDKTIKLYLIESIEYKWYYKNISRKTLTLGDGITLPVTLVTETYTQCERQRVELSESEAEALLKDRMLDEFSRAHPNAKIVKTEFYVIKNKDTCEGVLRLECAETTGIQIAR